MTVSILQKDNSQEKELTNEFTNDLRDIGKLNDCLSFDGDFKQTPDSKRNLLSNYLLFYLCHVHSDECAIPSDRKYDCIRRSDHGSFLIRFDVVKLEQ